MRSDLTDPDENSLSVKNCLPGGKKEIPLYSSFKGKEMHASGTWEATDNDKMLIYPAMALFWISVIAVFVGIFMKVSVKTMVILGVTAFAAAVLMAAALVWCIFRKTKERPMDVHYYDVDRSENFITGKSKDNTREISREEFFSGKSED